MDISRAMRKKSSGFSDVTNNEHKEPTHIPSLFARMSVKEGDKSERKKISANKFSSDS
jgi:hypothetical protein